MNKSVHLGSGAYVTSEPNGLIFTANHHDPELASDVVWLDDYAIQELKRFLEMLEKDSG